MTIATGVVPWCLDCGIPEHASGGEPRLNYTIQMSCPRCGKPLAPVNQGKPTDGGMAVNAIVKCTGGGCKRELAVHVRLMAMGVYNDEGTAHGTPMAYKEHKKNNESPCQECKDWHARHALDKARRYRGELADA